MSDQERFDWDDEMDFENLADEHDGDQGTEESIPAFNTESEVAPPLLDTEMEPESLVEDQPQEMTTKASLGLSAGGLGTLFAVSSLVSGLGLAGAVLFVGKLDPLSLWQPQGLSQVDQWFNFKDYPLNMLYILVVGVVVLSILGSWAVARSIKNARSRYELTAGLLNSLTSLRLDNEEAWQASELKADPKVAAFVVDTLGSWRLLSSRQKKNSGLEGEILRLQKALANKSREELVGQYDHPAVGKLADSMVELFDDQMAARSEVKELREKDRVQSEELISVLQDARSWNRSTGVKMGTHSSDLGKLAGRLEEIGNLVRQVSGGNDHSEVIATLVQVGRELKTPAPTAGFDKMNELVERGSKLAFQMAMEVARLGTRGERLLPMTQVLEELSTEFKLAAQTMIDGTGNPEMDRIQAHLAQVQKQLSKGPGETIGRLVETTVKLVPTVAQLSLGLAQDTQSFEHQDDRLTRLGETLADYSGAHFDPLDFSAGNPDNSPAGDLNITQQDPFGKPEEMVPEMDPFSSSSTPSLGLSSTPEDSGFLSSVTPGEEDSYQETEPALPPEEEKVYDLAEFGAIRMDEPNATSPQEEKVFDLSEFGAVTLS